MLSLGLLNFPVELPLDGIFDFKIDFNDKVGWSSLTVESPVDGIFDFKIDFNGSVRLIDLTVVSPFNGIFHLIDFVGTVDPSVDIGSTLYKETN